jgi:hypothetical protein
MNQQSRLLDCVHVGEGRANDTGFLRVRFLVLICWVWRTLLRYSDVLNYCQVRISSELINTIKTQKYPLTFSPIIIIIIKSFRIFKLRV